MASTDCTSYVLEGMNMSIMNMSIGIAEQAFLSADPSLQPLQLFSSFRHLLLGPVVYHLVRVRVTDASIVMIIMRSLRGWHRITTAAILMIIGGLFRYWQIQQQCAIVGRYWTDVVPATQHSTANRTWHLSAVKVMMHAGPAEYVPACSLDRIDGSLPADIAVEFQYVG